MYNSPPCHQKITVLKEKIIEVGKLITQCETLRNKNAELVSNEAKYVGYLRTLSKQCVQLLTDKQLLESELETLRHSSAEYKASRSHLELNIQRLEQLVEVYKVERKEYGTHKVDRLKEKLEKVINLLMSYQQNRNSLHPPQLPLWFSAEFKSELKQWKNSVKVNKWASAMPSPAWSIASSAATTESGFGSFESHSENEENTRDNNFDQGEGVFRRELDTQKKLTEVPLTIEKGATAEVESSAAKTSSGCVKPVVSSAEESTSIVPKKSDNKITSSDSSIGNSIEKSSKPVETATSAVNKKGASELKQPSNLFRNTFSPVENLATPKKCVSIFSSPTSDKNKGGSGNIMPPKKLPDLSLDPICPLEFPEMLTNTPSSLVRAISTDKAKPLVEPTSNSRHTSEDKASPAKVISPKGSVKSKSRNGNSLSRFSTSRSKNTKLNSSPSGTQSRTTSSDSPVKASSIFSPKSRISRVGRKNLSITPPSNKGGTKTSSPESHTYTAVPLGALSIEKKSSNSRNSPTSLISAVLESHQASPPVEFAVAGITSLTAEVPDILDSYNFSKPSYELEEPLVKTRDESSFTTITSPHSLSNDASISPTGLQKSVGTPSETVSSRVVNFPANKENTPAVLPSIASFNSLPSKEQKRENFCSEDVYSRLVKKHVNHSTKKAIFHAGKNVCKNSKWKKNALSCKPKKTKFPNKIVFVRGSEPAEKLEDPLQLNENQVNSLNPEKWIAEDIDSIPDLVTWEIFKCYESPRLHALSPIRGLSRRLSKGQKSADLQSSPKCFPVFEEAKTGNPMQVREEEKEPNPHGSPIRNRQKVPRKKVRSAISTKQKQNSSPEGKRISQFNQTCESKETQTATQTQTVTTATDLSTENDGKDAALKILSHLSSILVKKLLKRKRTKLRRKPKRANWVVEAIKPVKDPLRKIKKNVHRTIKKKSPLKSPRRYPIFDKEKSEESESTTPLELHLDDETSKESQRSLHQESILGVSSPCIVDEQPLNRLLRKRKTAVDSFRLESEMTGKEKIMLDIFGEMSPPRRVTRGCRNTLVTHERKTRKSSVSAKSRDSPAKRGSVNCESLPRVPHTDYFESSLSESESFTSSPPKTKNCSNLSVSPARRKIAFSNMEDPAVEPSIMESMTGTEVGQLNISPTPCQLSGSDSPAHLTISEDPGLLVSEEKSVDPLPVVDFESPLSPTNDVISEEQPLVCPWSPSKEEDFDPPEGEVEMAEPSTLLTNSEMRVPGNEVVISNLGVDNSKKSVAEPPESGAEESTLLTNSPMPEVVLSNIESDNSEIQDEIPLAQYHKLPFVLPDSMRRKKPLLVSDKVALQPMARPMTRSMALTKTTPNLEEIRDDNNKIDTVKDSESVRNSFLSETDKQNDLQLDGQMVKEAWSFYKELKTKVTPKRTPDDNISDIAPALEEASKAPKCHVANLNSFSDIAEMWERTRMMKMKKSVILSQNLQAPSLHMDVTNVPSIPENVAGRFSPKEADWVGNKAVDEKDNDNGDILANIIATMDKPPVMKPLAPVRTPVERKRKRKSPASKVKTTAPAVPPPTYKNVEEQIAVQAIESFLTAQNATTEEATAEIKKCVLVLQAVSDIILVKAIVHVVLENIDEELDLRFTPPAPPLTPSQHRLFVLFTSCRRFPPLYLDLLEALRSTMLPDTFTWPDDSLQSCARFHAAICRQMDEPDLAVRLCVDVAVGMPQRSCLVINAVLTGWPEVLPLAAQASPYGPGPTLAMLVMLTPNPKRLNQNNSMMSLKRLLADYYGYSREVDLTGWATQAVAALRKGDVGAAQALASVCCCSKATWAWTSSNVVSPLLEFLGVWQHGGLPDCTARRVLTVIARALIRFPENLKAQQAQAEALERIGEILLSGKLSHQGEEAIVESALSLNGLLTPILQRWVPRSPVTESLLPRLQRALLRPKPKMQNMEGKKRKNRLRKRKTKLPT